MTLAGERWLALLRPKALATLAGFGGSMAKFGSPSVASERSERLAKDGGEGGIRTHVPLTGQDAFEAPPLRPLRYLSVFHYARWGPLNIPHLAARSRSPSATSLRRSLAAAGAYSLRSVEPLFLSPPRCALAIFGPRSSVLGLRSSVLGPRSSVLGLRYSPFARRSSKNACITSRHSASSTRPVTSMRWFSAGCSCARIADSMAPAFGSGAP
jgi:hypothetical protein